MLTDPRDFAFMKKSFLALLAAALMPTLAQAALAPEPAVINFDGNIELTPSLGVGVMADDNFYSEPEGGEDSTGLFVVRPAVIMRRGDDERFGKVTATAEAGVVSEESDDNYTDFDLAMSGRQPLAANAGIEGSFGYRYDHDARGSGNTQGCRVGGGTPQCDAEPDLFSETYFRVNGMLGVADSRGQLSLGADLSQLTYLNNEQRTQFLDYDRQAVHIKFDWRIGGGGTALTLDANIDRYDYVIGDDSDNIGTELLGGVRWDVTGKTTGYAKAGLLEKDFEGAGREDLSNTSWYVGIDWSPSELNMLKLSGSQRYEESDVFLADAELVNAYSLQFTHLVTDRVEPFVRLTKEITEYQGINREDEVDTISLGVDYKFRRWAVLGASWNTREETSNVGAGLLDYNRDVFALSANMTF